MTELQFYFIYCSYNGISMRNLINRMYYYLMADKQVVFKYNLNSKGIFSNALSSYINELIAVDCLEVRDGLVFPSKKAQNMFDNTGILMLQEEILSRLEALLDNLTDLEVEEGIAVNLLIEDYSKKYGWVNIKEYTSDIVKTMQGLYPDFDRKTLNKVIKAIRFAEEVQL